MLSTVMRSSEGTGFCGSRVTPKYSQKRDRIGDYLIFNCIELLYVPQSSSVEKCAA